MILPASSLLSPARVVEPISWVGHIPFAFWIVEALKPRIFVELGTHTGNSYFAFCQSVAQHKLDTRCYAVDTWQGDPHAGFYDNQVFEDVSAYHNLHYEAFSRLLRMTFDDAVCHFSDRSIDLLHIDGLHTYEAVRHDFELWLPKMSERGVVLFHDINVRAHDFGVWKFWEEACRQYPHFSFDHSNGLGVLVTGIGQESVFVSMFNDFTSTDNQFLYKTFFLRLGRIIEIDLQMKIIERQLLESERHKKQFRDAEVEQRKRVEFLELALDQHREKALQSNKELETSDSLINTMKRKLHEMEYQLDEQSILLSNTRKELARLKNSSSWRMTKPIRKLTKSTRKRARKLRDILQQKEEKSCEEIINKNQNASSLDAAGGSREARFYPEIARPLEIDYSISIPFQFDFVPELQAESIAAVIHIFYLELSVELKSYLKNIPIHTDLYISTTDDHKAAAITSIFSDWAHGSVDVRIVPNRGRDIAPKLIAFADVYDRYDYVVFLHSKRSFHADALSPWRYFLFESLIGTPEVVLSILKLLQFNPHIGMVAAQHFEPMRHWVNWGGNFQLAQNLCEKMGFVIKEEDPLDFPSGSMFWARTAAIRPLIDLALRNDDFAEEADQKDGTLAHAVERIFFHTCEYAGLDWIKIARNEFYTSTPGIHHSSNQEELREFCCQNVFHLLNPKGVKPRSVMPDPVTTCPPKLFQYLRTKSLGISQHIKPGMKVAVGIVYYNNTHEEIRRSIGAAKIALTHAGVPLDGSLFVIDNGKSPINADEYTGFIVLQERDGNLGFGKAHNRLMKKAFQQGFDVYITVNPDGMLHPDAILALLKTLMAAKGDALIEALQFPEQHPKPYDNHTMDTPWVSGACLAIPKKIYNAIGDFDERFFMYCEDVDLSWRAKAHGYALKTCPRALFLHAVTNRSLTKESLRMLYESGIFLARKWRSKEFEQWLIKEINARNFAVPSGGYESVNDAWLHVADFSNYFSFSQPRW